MKKWIPWILAVALLVLILWTAWQTTALELNELQVSCQTLPDSFEGYRIAQVSDLHNTQIGDHNERLLEMLRNAEPDMIAITGDLIDSRNPDVQIALDFAGEAVKLAPCYYVTGNHEARVPEEFAQLEQGLRALGVQVLRDEAVLLEKGGQCITLAGVDDPAFENGEMGETLHALTGDRNVTVLLSHRPELFDIYANCGVALTLSGHVHGGQIRLPYFGAIISPQLELFPKYSEGLYTQGSANMVVSRGIGNSVIPFRFNNPPEVVLVTLTGQ